MRVVSPLLKACKDEENLASPILLAAQDDTYHMSSYLILYITIGNPRITIILNFPILF